MNILLFRIDKIGDLIVSTPVIGAIRAKYPDARIMLVASPYNAVAVDGMAEIDELVLFTPERKNETLKKIHAFRPDAALVLSPRHDAYVLSLRSGGRPGWIVMEYRWLARLFADLFLKDDQREDIPRAPRTQHHSQHVLSLARKMGLTAEGEFPYRIAPPEPFAFDRPYIAVHIVDKWVEAEWTTVHVRNFLKNVEQEFGLPIMLTAGPADTILSEAIGHHFTLHKNLSFKAWAGVLNGAAAVIAPDCAAVHIACALEKPLLALYPAHRFEKAMLEYGPRGTRFYARPITAPDTQMPELIDDLRHLLTVETQP
jgi:heptosyltransferase-3